MGWAARVGQKRKNYKSQSCAVQWWDPKFPPSAIVIMRDRMHIVVANGSLRRLPIGEAFNVKVISVTTEGV